MGTRPGVKKTSAQTSENNLVYKKEWYNGTALEDMPCRRYSEFNLVINSDGQEALGIELPEDYAAQATYVTTVRAN